MENRENFSVIYDKIKLRKDIYLFDERSYVYILKGFAIISVVCVHAAGVPEEYPALGIMLSKIFMIYGALGVPVFFIVSGYLFAGTEKSFRSFVVARFQSIIIPWMFCGTLVWLYVVLRKGGIHLLSWMQFIVGIQSYMYYLMVLTFFYVSFWDARKSKVFMYMAIIFSGLSIFLTNIEEIYQLLYGKIFTPYLNPLNWMGYFAAGILLKGVGLKAVKEKCVMVLPVVLPVWILCMFVHIKMDWNYSYWSDFALLCIPLSVMSVMGVAGLINKTKKKAIHQLGQESFSIYLLHMLLVGGIVSLTSRLGIGILVLIRPAVVLLFLFGMFWILDIINLKSNQKFHFCNFLIGRKIEIKEKRS